MRNDMIDREPPCDCGALDPRWQGPEDGVREYCCDICYRARCDAAHRVWMVKYGNSVPDGFIAPRGFDTWNRSMRGAYLKGWIAAEAGLGIERCPYDDKRKPSGRLSWSRAYQNAWRDGWEDYGRARST